MKAEIDVKVPEAKDGEKKDDAPKPAVNVRVVIVGASDAALAAAALRACARSLDGGWAVEGRADPGCRERAGRRVGLARACAFEDVGFEILLAV